MKNTTIEKRLGKNFELRAVDQEGDRKYIECIIPYNKISEDLGFFEKLSPGCFTRSIKNGTDVKALYQHIDAEIIGRIKNDTLILTDSPTELRAKIILPPTHTGDEIYTLVKEGYISNCSFRMRVLKESWDKETRTVHEAHLIEISPVTFPAYSDSDTKISLRGLFESNNIDEDKLMDGLKNKDNEMIKEALKPILNVEVEKEDKPAEGTLFETELLEKEIELMKNSF